MLLILLALSLATDDAADVRKKELARLEGKWQGVGGEEVGTVLTREDAEKEGEELVFKGDTVKFLREGKLLAEFTLTLDPSKTPREITFHFTGELKGKKCLAIYALEGDKLTICTATKMRPTKDDMRPNDLSTMKTTEKGKRPGLLLFILERKK